MNALQQFLQSASNAAASNVSGPVDLIAAGLRKLGVPVPQNALMSSQWMEEQGLTRKVPQNALSLAGETVGMVAPIAAAAKAPQIAAAMNQAGANLAAPKTLNPQTGAIVWHGSPHKFDKFDSSKIGTGEGAQAYGHGLYLADSPDVAQQYQRALSGRDLTEVGGQRVADLQISDDAKSFVQQVAANVQRGKTLEQAASVLRKNIELGHPNAKAMQEALSVLDGGVTRGALYKVDLPDTAISRMLDWDKPLSQQAPEVQQSFLKAQAGNDPLLSELLDLSPAGMQLQGMVPSAKGSAAYKTMAEPKGHAAAAELLRSAGIPGIRYLDGGSRGAGAGTYNYVVFPGEENMLRILERNGQPLR